MAFRASVVVATFNRRERLFDLLRDLGRQVGVDPSDFEVIVVDDGSVVPVVPHLDALELPYAVRGVRQDNAGQASARDRGIRMAEGEVIVILDDDMKVGPDFLAAHLAAHDAGLEVVLGVIRPADHDLPLFERWHARQLERFARAVREGRIDVRGADLATGNVSFRRALYFQVGGFDRSLARSEDKELGMRFEKAGAHFGLSERAASIHRSDHERFEEWLARSVNYGVYDSRIARKHADDEHADPWKFVFVLNPLMRPLVLTSAALPPVGAALGGLFWQLARLLDAAGAEKPALMGTTVVYGMAYFRGMRRESGSLLDAARDLGGYVVKRGRHRIAQGGRSAVGAAATLVRAVRGDFAAMRAGRKKYLDDDVSPAALPREAVQKIGLQMMVAVRAMRFLRDAGSPLAARVASRLIRHAYGAEIHWDAELEPGCSIIHGNGLVVSHAARVGAGCVLAHNVTLGHAVDPETRVAGAPVLGRNVHVGPGATLLGPITVGDGSKIMAGAVLTRSVPPGSLVRPPEPEVSSRRGALGPRPVTVPLTQTP